MNERIKSRFEVIVVTSCGRNNNLDEKNIAGQVLTYKSKNFHRPHKKLDLERTMSELRKNFKKKNRKSMSNCRT